MSDFKENRFQKFLRVRIGDHLLMHRWLLYVAIFVVSFLSQTTSTQVLGFSGYGGFWVGVVITAFGLMIPFYSLSLARRHGRYRFQEMMAQMYAAHNNSFFARGHDVVAGEVVHKEDDRNAS